MATKPTSIGSQAARRRHLYLTQWRESRGLSVETMAGRIGISRQSVYRWETEQWRMDPEKQAAYAAALGDDVKPEQLWRMPDKAPSIDAMLADQPEELKETAADIVRRLVRKG